MRIIIPSYRRAYAQHTYLALPEEWQAKTTWVVDEHDAASLRSVHPETQAEIVVHPPEIKTIAAKRAWILRTTPHRKIVMFDDDLRFAVRATQQPVKLTQATKFQVGYHLNSLSKFLDEYHHAGFSARQGNNHHSGGFVMNNRMMYVLGYVVETVRQHCELGRIEHREDMDYTLQLLRKGYPNAVITDICVDQGFNAEGGCKAQGRTVEASNQDAEKLASLHPGLVKVVQRDYAGSIPRKEVVVSWKKAYQSCT